MENIVQLKVDAKDAIASVHGMDLLITAAATFISRCEAGEVRSIKSYQAFKEALETIASGRPDGFYHLEGQPAQFDIDEEAGKLLVQCERALDFVHRGPPVIATKEVINEMYDNRIIKLIPKLKTLLESRVMVKIPYKDLVNESFNLRNDIPENIKPSDFDKFATSIARMGKSHEDLVKQAEGYSVEKAEPINAKATIMYLATMMEHLHQIMWLFGWSIDDVMLASRRQISELTEGSEVPE